MVRPVHVASDERETVSQRAGPPARKVSSPAVTDAALAPSDADRRNGARRNTGISRLLTARATTHVGTTWLPAGWPLFPVTMLLSVALATWTVKEFPTFPAMILMGCAMLGTFARARARQVEQHLEGVRAHAVAIATVSLPLVLFASGMQLWREYSPLTDEATTAALLLLSGVAAVYTRRHPVLIFVSKISIWLPFVLATPSMTAFVGLAYSFVIAVIVSREQIAMDLREELERQARERVHSRARDILAEYEETGQGWFWETDRRSQLTYVSSPVAEMLGGETEDLLGRPLKTLFDLSQAQEGERTLTFHLSARSAFQELAVRAATADERWWSVSGRPIYDHFDNFVGFRGSGTDLTEKRRSQEHATRLATFDSLTGLANRFQMAQSLEKILSAPQEMHRCCAVFLIDLDRFKQVNDTLGHPAGDALLKQVAQRLERAVGKMGMVGRLGGDEFKIIIPNRIERRRLGELAERVIHSLSQPYSLDGHTAIIGASVGIALSPADGKTSEELIRNADLALYAAKDGGRGRFHFYAQELHAEAEARASLEKDLRAAIQLGELQLFYQPVVATATEQIVGFEALMRWKHPKRGWIPPSKFISIAEDSGLISQMGEWALRTACADLARWPESVRCAVNVSPLQFANRNLPAIVTHAIASAEIDPARLELEITESVFLNDDEGTDAMFAALKGIGVRLALDDFGTGYSSLGYLKKAPFDKIKIDQSFVRGATEPGSRNGAIIASITSLAQQLGMDTTAEGVETLDELDLVRMHGCSHVQGYIYEQPLAADAATERLETGLAAVARGPRSARAPRQTTLRKVLLDHQGAIYNGTVRNISSGGAMIEGLWNVPVGTIFQIQLAKGASVTATTRWSQDDRMGVEFATPIRREIPAVSPAGRDRVPSGRAAELRKAG
ncbi:EAL domain-containing protein [Tsuneonella sp. HG222]